MWLQPPNKEEMIWIDTVLEFYICLINTYYFSVLHMNDSNGPFLSGFRVEF